MSKTQVTYRPMIEHPPVPLHIDDDKLICGEMIIAHISGPANPNSKSDAAFIVRACNAHEKLVEALEQIIKIASRDESPPYLHPMEFRQIAQAALTTARGASSEDTPK